jgi:hypothetical protein
VIPTCSESEWLESRRRTDEWAWLVAQRLPNGWIERDLAPLARRHPEIEGQRAYDHRDGRHVVGTIGQHDGGWWLHVSVSRAKYIPSYEDLADVKRVFIGDGLQAVQLFPRRERHVNIHPYCLHLWARVDALDGLPDFGAHGTI